MACSMHNQFSCLLKPSFFLKGYHVKRFILIIFFLIYSKSIWANNGDDGGTQGNTYQDCGVPFSKQNLLKECQSDRRDRATYAIVGDSRAAVLYPGLVRNSDESSRFVIIGSHLPLISINALYSRHQKVSLLATDVLVKNKDIKAVVLATAARAILSLENDYSIEDLEYSKNFDLAFAGLDNYVTKLVAAGKKIIILIDNPTLADPKDCEIDDVANRKGKCTISVHEHIRLSTPYRLMLSKIQEKHPQSVQLFDPTSMLCDVRAGECATVMNGRTLYSYTDHISDYAGGLIAKKLIPILKNFAP
jgi:hypothetical protein